MSTFQQIKVHVKALFRGNIWKPAKRRFHLQGIQRALHLL